MKRSTSPIVALAMILAMMLGAAGTASAADSGEVVVIRAVSNRADLISGGDVLLEIDLPTGASASDLTVTAGAIDVTDAFVTFEGRLIGLVEGLPLGPSVITATLADGNGARLSVDNHPIGGPVFAGPQVTPWFCNTVEAGLGEPLDDQCNAPTQYSFRYMSAVTGLFAPYDPDAPPDDVARTTTDEGVTVPYIVRLEKGTIDRSIYQLLVLFDPDQPWTPTAPQEAWNGKLVWSFGGGTGPGHNQALPPGLEMDSALSRGFMVATSSLTIHGKNANDTVSAEVLMMAKEEIAEAYGPIRYLIGTGCSGGGLQQHIIADTYPGILDGLLPNCSYPDIWTTAMEVVDCVLLGTYFAETSPELWAVAQQRAFVAGHQDPGSCPSWASLFGPRFDPSLATNCAIDATLVYEPDSNPSGTRCSLPDYQIAIWGRRGPAQWGPVEQQLGHGFARLPVSNVGVQYGLGALEDSTITAEQFVDLNEKVGGLDVDGQPTTARLAADPGAAADAYRTGQIVQGHNLDTVPIIDLRGHDNTEIHTDTYSRVTALRLLQAHGHNDNQAVWTGPVPLIGEPEWVFCGEAIESGLGNADFEIPDSPVPCSEGSPFLTMDRWLTDIEADTSAIGLAQKVLDHRPANAVDACYIGGQQVTDEAACSAAYPVFDTTRMTAGGPQTNDIIECTLVEPVREDYPVAFTDEQWARLLSAYPTGVCDYGQPGLGVQPAIGTWLSFADSDTSTANSTGASAAPVPLGAAPVSVPFGPGVPGGAGEDSLSGGLAATGPAFPLTLLALAALSGAMLLRARSQTAD